MTTITQVIESKAYTLVLHSETPFKRRVNEAIQKLVDSDILSPQQTGDIVKWKEWYFKEKCGEEAPLVLLILDGIDPLLEINDEQKQFLLMDARDQLASLLSDLGKAILRIGAQVKSRDKAVAEIFEEVRQGLMALQANRRENMQDLDASIASLIHRLEVIGEKVKKTAGEAAAAAEDIVSVKSALKAIVRDCHELLHTIR